MKKIVMRIYLETKTFFTIGMGGVIESDVNLVFSRTFIDNKDYLMIPGSSLKGVLRRNASSIAEYFGLKSCHTVNPHEMIKDLDNCDICDLFGAPNRDGRVYVRSSIINADTIILTRIRVNMKTGTVFEKALFKQEVLPPMTQFSFILEFHPKSILEEKLVMMSINELNYQKIGRAGSVEVKKVELLEGELSKETIELCRKVGLRVIEK